MKLTKENKLALAEMLYESAKTGRPIQFLNGDGEWGVGWNEALDFAYGPDHYRLKPIEEEPPLMRVEDLPPVCWVRRTDCADGTNLITYRSKDEIAVATDDGDLSIAELDKNCWQWSSDLKTWHDFRRRVV